MPVSVRAQVCAVLTVPGDNPQQYVIREGDIVQNLVIRKGGKETSISGAVRVLEGSVNKMAISQTCPPEPYFYKLVNVTGFIIDCSNEYRADLVKVSTSDIMSIGSIQKYDEVETPEADNVVSIGANSQYKAIDEVLASVDEGATIKLAAGEYDKPLAIDKSVSFVGPNDYPQNKVSPAVAKASVYTKDAAISKAVTVNNKDAEVEFRGVTFTEDALVKVTAAKSVKIVNCRFENLAPITKKTMPIEFCDHDAVVKVTIEGNYFGDNQVVEDKACYNYIEGTVNFANGSSVSNNYFTRDCCTHNQIAVYGIEDKAVIAISKNTSEYSANMIRLSLNGEQTCTVNCNSNTYLDTDPAEEGRYAGLLMFQPYNQKTTSYANMTVNINDTVHSDDKQVAYLYYGANDTAITVDKMPKVKIDGIAYNLPVIH